MCLFVCLSVCFLSATRHLSTLLRCLRVREQEPSRRGRPRARGQACTARARARMPYNFSTKKSYADAFQKQNRSRAHAVVYVTAEIFKKGKKETNMPLPKFGLQFAFSCSVYFSNRTESYSSQIEFAGPHFKQNYWQEETSYLIFGRSRPWSASAHAVVYVTAEIFKKREKENQHATSQVRFTVCLLLECLLFESY